MSNPKRTMPQWIKRASQRVRAHVVDLTIEQVQQHTSKESVFIILADVVYDVTSFQMYHPGGSTVLRRLAGQDATAQFQKVHGHVNVSAFLGNYVVGRIVPSTQPQSSAGRSVPSSRDPQPQSSPRSSVDEEAPAPALKEVDMKKWLSRAKESGGPEGDIGAYVQVVCSTLPVDSYGAPLKSALRKRKVDLPGGPLSASVDAPPSPGPGLVSGGSSSRVLRSPSAVLAPSDPFAEEEVQEVPQFLPALPPRNGPAYVATQPTSSEENAPSYFDVDVVHTTFPAYALARAEVPVSLPALQSTA